ncbi:MAG: hypothetical protein V3S89_00615 [Desulfobacterales bacterium]
MKHRIERTVGIADDKQLSALVDLDSHEAVLDEVLDTLGLIPLDDYVTSLSSVYTFSVDLYEGRHEGYRSCNTEYHNLHHTKDTFLTMARLIHGAAISGVFLSDRQVILSLIASLAHDTGYIQAASDRKGTGAKYTANHVQRSMDFLERHAAEYSLSAEEATQCQLMILCTDIAFDISETSFPSLESELLCKMLGAADLLAQMADRVYLEKLLFLYYELKEANIGDYESELDLLKKTVKFYGAISDRLEAMHIDVDRFLTSHFASRWDIQENLYDKAIQRQREYLAQILRIPDSDPTDFLKRDMIVEKVHRQYAHPINRL